MDWRQVFTIGSVALLAASITFLIAMMFRARLREAPLVATMLAIFAVSAAVSRIYQGNPAIATPATVVYTLSMLAALIMMARKTKPSSP